MMKNSIEENIQYYLAAWNEKERQLIKANLEKCLSADSTYTDKNTAAVKGLEAFTDLIVHSYDKMPEREFSITSALDHFDNKGCYYWRVTFPNKDAKEGMDYIEYNEENKITTIVGFV